MTDRTNLDVAADAIANLRGLPLTPSDEMARAALDAIHPALADLTPDDVADALHAGGWAWVTTVNGHEFKRLSRD